jgi:hypothetical protein
VAAALAVAVLLPGVTLPLRRGADAAVVVAQAAAADPAAVASATPAPPASAPATDGPADDAGHTAAAPPAAEPASAPAEAEVAWPVDVPPRQGRIERPPLVPRLSDAERQAARQSARALRAEPAVRADDKAWALVTDPLDPRRAERAAAQLQAVALFQAHPMRVERMPAGGRWRAVFWPFTSAADAEKVRLALADKGLKTEVLEF